MLEIRNLRKIYGDFSVKLNLSVADGETLALVGPSGCGKTTALNLIAGLIQADSGEILIDGEDSTALPPWKRNISVVFQDLALFPHLTVGKNIAYGPFIRRIPKPERQRLVAETLKAVRLEGYEKRRIDTLSGGERQRAAIARSLAASPRALLLDEPFSSLDAPLRRQLRREFLALRSRSRAPWVFVTHDREEAGVIGDRIALMSAGRIIETGPARDLFLTPKTRFGAQFFGAGTLLPCGIFIPKDAIYFEPKDGSSIAVNAVIRSSVFEGDRVTVELEVPAAGKNGGILNAETGPRTSLPPRGSAVTVYINRGLVRGVPANT
jgi:ABC-type Fe3+/spermidine/putrescine transport system ATPase subunit